MLTAMGFLRQLLVSRVFLSIFFDEDQGEDNDKESFVRLQRRDFRISELNSWFLTRSTGGREISGIPVPGS